MGREENQLVPMPCVAMDTLFLYPLYQERGLKGVSIVDALSALAVDGLFSLRREEMSSCSNHVRYLQCPTCRGSGRTKGRCKNPKCIRGEVEEMRRGVVHKVPCRECLCKSCGGVGQLRTF